MSSFWSYGGTLHMEAGPEPTAENPCPVGMVFTHQMQNGVFLAEVDPITHAAGRPQRFRVKGMDIGGAIELEPVFLGKDGRFVGYGQPR